MTSSPSVKLAVLPALILAILFPGASLGQEMSADPTETPTRVAPSSELRSGTPRIEVIRVLGQRQTHRHDETGSVVLLNRETIEQLQPLSTDDVLRRVAGINIASEEETSIVANFGIRGLSASESKSLLLEDGVPVAPGLFIGNDRYFNPRIQRVERVEILKGSASLRYGPSTIGGVVNFQTKNPEQGLHVHSRIGSFNLREITVEAGQHHTQSDAFAGIVFTHAQSDGFMDKGYEMNDLMVKAGATLSDNQRIGVKFSWHENEANISYRGLLLEDYLSGARYNPAPDDDYLTDRVAFDVNYEWLLAPTVALNIIAYWSEVSRDYWRYNVNTAASNEAGRWVYTDDLTGNNRSFDRYGVETRLSIHHDIFNNPAHSEFGLRFMQESSDDQRVRATRANDRSGVVDRHRQDAAESYAGYVQTRMEVSERFAVTPGIRIENYTQTRRVLLGNTASVSTSNTEFLPGVGATLSIHDQAELYGGIYRAFSPAANGVALDGLTDQNLRGERSVNYELGLRGQFGELRYDVAAFFMDFSNQVVTGNSDPNLSQSNAGKTEHLGFELALQYRLSSSIMLDGNITYVPKSEFMTGDFLGNRLPYAPEWLANLGISYRAEHFSIALNAHHRGQQFGDPTNNTAIPTHAAGGIWGGLMPAYTVYDLLAQSHINKQLSIFGSVKNLTDKQYISGLRQGIYAGPERSLEVGFRFRF